MITPALPPQRLQEIRNLYRSAVHSAAPGPDMAQTPDGSVTVSCGVDYGGCLDSGSSWARASDASGAEIYRYQTKTDRPFHGAAVLSSGSLAYAGQTVDRREKIVELPIRPGGFLGGIRRFEGVRTIATLSQPATALAVSKDDSQLAVAAGGDVKVFDLRHGWLSTRVGAAPRTLGHLPESPYALRFLSDGSLLVYPQRWQTACYRVSPAGAQRIGLRDLDPDRFRAQVSSSVSDLVPKDAMDAFLQSCDWLVEDTGEVRDHRSAIAPDGSQTAVAVAGEPGATLWSWDARQGRARKVADLGSDVAARSLDVRWTPDGSHVLLVDRSAAAPPLRIVNVSNGRLERVNALDTARSFQVSNAGDKVAVFSAEGPTLMLWERATGRSRPLLPLGPSDAPARGGEVHIEFTPDASHAVLWYAPQGLKAVTAHVVAMDGTDTAIPGLDGVRLEGSTLHLMLGGQDHAVAVPGDLAGLQHQTWYESVPDGALFGRAPGTPHGHIERDANVVRLGDVVVPIRRPPRAAASSAEGA